MCLLNWRPFIFVKCWGPQIFLPSSLPSHFAISPVSFVRFRSAAAFDVLLLFLPQFFLVCLLVLNWRETVSQYTVCKLTQTDNNLRLLGCSKLTGWDLPGVICRRSHICCLLLKEKTGKNEQWIACQKEKEGNDEVEGCSLSSSLHKREIWIWGIMMDLLMVVVVEVLGWLLFLLAKDSRFLFAHSSPSSSFKPN